MSYYTLAISSSSHDSSICLLEDNNIVFMSPCERLNRRKHTQEVLEYDLSVVTRYINDVDLVVLANVYDNPDNPHSPAYAKKQPRINAAIGSESIASLIVKLRNVGITYKKLVIDNANHHTYHAAAGFYCSGFNEALCLTIDSAGSSWTWDDVRLSETTTIHYISYNACNTLYKHLYYKSTNNKLIGWSDQHVELARQTFPYPVEISPHLDTGKMYGTVTRHTKLGSPLDAGKLMGLSGYGKPNSLPPMLIGDTIISDANFFRNDSQLNTFLYPHLSNPSEEVKRDLAYNVQKALEKVFVARVRQALELKQCNNLVIGGGCALNILGNTAIKRAFPNLNIFVDPIAADSTLSLGAALYHYNKKFPQTKFTKIKDLYLGTEYSIVDIKQKILKLVECYNNEPSL